MGEGINDNFQKSLLQRAMDQANEVGHPLTRPFHLLIAIVYDTDIYNKLNDAGFPVENLKSGIEKVYGDFTQDGRSKSLTEIGNAHFENRLTLIWDSAEKMMNKYGRSPETQALALLMLLEDQGDAFTNHVMSQYLDLEENALQKLFIQEVNKNAKENPNSGTQPILDEDGNPVSKISREAALGIGDSLKKTVFFQDEAIDELEDSFVVQAAGLKEPNKPLANYLFVGPTGVGKTEVSLQLADTLGLPMIRLDMSEFSNSADIPKLIGGAPQWVGYEQEGLLTAPVDKNPHCVLLLDEIEKADPDVFNILLQIMDHGKLTNSHGKEIDFKNVILIMTSNAGAKEATKDVIGFGDRKNEDGADYDAALKILFSPEFRNRLTGTVRFDNLPKQAIPKILRKKIDKLNNLDGCVDNNLKIVVSDETLEKLTEDIYNKEQNGRVAERAVLKMIKRPLARQILDGLQDSEVHFSYDGGEPKLSPKPLVIPANDHDGLADDGVSQIEGSAFEQHI